MCVCVCVCVCVCYLLCISKYNFFSFGVYYILSIISDIFLRFICE